MKQDKRMCPNEENEEPHLLYCMNCDMVYGCDEDHNCETHCVVISDK